MGVILMETQYRSINVINAAKAEYAWLCYAPENTVARRLYASLGFEEVPEAYNPEDDEILAVLKLLDNP